MFSKVLIANRGEIAVRIMRACEELGVATVAVYSELDRDAVHVKRADEAYLLGPGPASESYLAIDKLIDAVQRSGAEAVHPGYGFLAENVAFAAALEEAGITFIGPPASAIEAMGSKTRARELMAEAGVPIVPGTTEPVETIEDAKKVIADTIGYPVAVKAAGGGGGKGFRVALEEAKLQDAFEGAAREGEKFFGDATVYLERYLPGSAPRRGPGARRHPRERDPPRRARLLAAAPPPEADRGGAGAGRRSELRARIGKIATDAAAAVNYTGAGTIEGLLQDGEYFFLEMNTRVQVEHCVTEMVTGIDIVKEGIRVAAGEPLSISQDDVELRGHAIECRINAEDASKNFAPAPGSIGDYREPAGPGVRVDSGVGPGSEISPMYDPMVAKLIVWDVDREQATARMLRALGEYEIENLKTLHPVPHRDPPDAPVARRRDLPRPDRGPRVAEGAGVPQAGEAAGAGRRRSGARAGRAELHGRGVRQALRRQGDRPAAGRAARSTGRPRPRWRRRGRRAPAAQRAGPGAAAAGGAATRCPHRSRGPCSRSPSSRAPTSQEGALVVRDRGDEDGERDHRAQGRHRSPSCRSRWAPRWPPATRSR